jgi:phosphoglycerate dehydrogenase-like enzyme
MPLTVLITDNDLGDSQLERLLLTEALGADVVVRQCRDEDEVVASVREVDPDAMLVQWAPVTRAVLEAAPRLQIISRFGIGVDMIDGDAAAEHGVAVANVPHYCVEEVATHAFALGLSLWRRLPQLDAGLRQGRWDAASEAPAIRRLSRSTVGLVGLGRIGRLVADRFASWGCRVIVADPVAGDDGYERVDLDRIADEADLISLHAPLLPGTSHLVGEAFLRRCRRRPIIVNTSRGGLIDSASLARALHEGVVAAAGLDVFDGEPLAVDDPLRGAPNTLLTPHAAWASEAALPDLRRETAENVVRHFSSAPRGHARQE